MPEMDIKAAKLRIFDLSKKAEALKKLHADFRSYIDQLVRTRQGEMLPIVPVREALSLRLHDHEHHFYEWHNGERGLHSEIFGLVDHFDNYPRVAHIAEAVIRADARFEHEISRYVDECALLEMKIALLVEDDPLMVTREGVFVAGKLFDAFRRIQKVLATAKKSIVIIDGYVNESILDMVGGLGVGVQILTLSVSGSMKMAATKFNAQHGGGSLAIRTSNGFHDRFVIIDGADFYHFGASLHDAGKRGFMYSRIEEPSVIAAFRAEWQKQWAAATIVS